MCAGWEGRLYELANTHDGETFVNMVGNPFPWRPIREDKAFDTIREYLVKKPGAPLPDLSIRDDEGVVSAYKKAAFSRETPDSQVCPLWH